MIMLFILYIITVILADICTLLYYKDEFKRGKYLGSIPTIEHFCKYYNIILLINFLPLFNFISIIGAGGTLIWNKIKKIRL